MSNNDKMSVKINEYYDVVNMSYENLFDFGQRSITFILQDKDGRKISMEVEFDNDGEQQNIIIIDENGVRLINKKIVVGDEQDVFKFVDNNYILDNDDDEWFYNWKYSFDSGFACKTKDLDEDRQEKEKILQRVGVEC